MLEKIKTWLADENRDFNEGLNLFVEQSRNRSLYLYLVRKKDMDKLVYELNKIANHLEATTPKVVKLEVLTGNTETGNTETGNTETGNTETGAPDHHSLIPGDELVIEDADEEAIENLKNRFDPSQLVEPQRSTFFKISDAYKVQRSFHEKMKLAETDEQRAEFYAEVVRLDDIITAGWKELDDWKASVDGFKADQQKAADALKPVDPVAIGKEINSARKFISVGLVRLDKVSGDVKTALTDQLRKKVETLKTLNAAISDETVAKLQAAGVIE